MSFKISRQRYFETDRLAVEICSGTKYVGKDILTTRYKELGESKYLVSPMDAAKCALAIAKKWEIDYHDEKKLISLVNFAGTGDVQLFNYDSPKECERVIKICSGVVQSMNKCGHCGRLLGKTYCETEEMPNIVFCDEKCYSFKYKTIFGTEAPALLKVKKKK